jgi:hypothetical protein
LLEPIKLHDHLVLIKTVAGAFLVSVESEQMLQVFVIGFSCTASQRPLRSKMLWTFVSLNEW